VGAGCCRCCWSAAARLPVCMQVTSTKSAYQGIQKYKHGLGPCLSTVSYVAHSDFDALRCQRVADAFMAACQDSPSGLLRLALHKAGSRLCSSYMKAHGTHDAPEQGVLMQCNAMRLFSLKPAGLPLWREHGLEGLLH
jgi:hypothetical protein